MNNPLKYTDPSGWQLVNDGWGNVSTARMSGNNLRTSFMPELSKMEGLFYDYSWGTNNSGLKYNWHTQSYQMNGADITHMEAMSMVHTTYFSTAEETYKRTDYLIPGSPGDMMGTGVYSIVRERYSSQPITAKNTGRGLPQGGGGDGWYDKANTVLGALGFSNDIKNEIIEYAGRIGSMGKSTATYLKYSKGLGIAGSVVTTGFSANNVRNQYNSGGVANVMQHRDVLDASVGTIGLGATTLVAFGMISNPVGWAIGTGVLIYGGTTLVIDAVNKP
jgi:hypothetical protein